MAVTSLAAPIALGILAVAFFFISFKYREQERFGRFEIFFTFGNLFVLSILYLLLADLQANNDSFQNVMLPMFEAFLWIYVLVNVILFFRMFKNLLFSIMHSKGKGYD